MSLELVKSIKADLERRGVDLKGPCGAFEVTKRVAWALRGQNAGLHHKPSGNNCQSYSVDVVIFPDGTYFDVLRDAGGDNEPTWNRHQGEARFWRSPIEVDLPAEAPNPTPTPPPDGSQSHEDALRAILALQARVVEQGEEIEALKANVVDLGATLEAVKGRMEEISFLLRTPKRTSRALWGFLQHDHEV